MNDASTRSCTTFEIVSSSRTAQTAVYRTTSSFSRSLTRPSFQTLCLGRRWPQTIAVEVSTACRGHFTADSARSWITAVTQSYCTHQFQICM